MDHRRLKVFAFTGSNSAAEIGGPAAGSAAARPAEDGGESRSDPAAGRSAGPDDAGRPGSRGHPAAPAVQTTAPQAPAVQLASAQARQPIANQPQMRQPNQFRSNSSSGPPRSRSSVRSARRGAAAAARPAGRDRRLRGEPAPACAPPRATGAPRPTQPGQPIQPGRSRSRPSSPPFSLGSRPCAPVLAPCPGTRPGPRCRILGSAVAQVAMRPGFREGVAPAITVPPVQPAPVIQACSAGRRPAGRSGAGCPCGPCCCSCRSLPASAPVTQAAPPRHLDVQA